MVKLTKVVGAGITIGSIYAMVALGFLIIGLLPLNPDLAVKIPILLIVLALCFIAAWLGYVMATAPTRPERQAREENR